MSTKLARINKQANKLEPVVNKKGTEDIIQCYQSVFHFITSEYTKAPAFCCFRQGHFWRKTITNNHHLKCALDFTSVRVQVKD